MKRHFFRIMIFVAIAGLLSFPLACSKKEEPPPKPQVAPAPAPAPTPAPEPEKKVEAPPAAPEKKVEKPAPAAEKAKPKAAEPAKAAKPAAEKKAPEKEVIAEDSIYLTQSISQQADGVGCMANHDGTAERNMAIADAKKKVIDQVLADIKAKTKSPGLKNALVAAYSDAKLDGFKIIRMSTTKDEAKGFCTSIRVATEVVPDPEKIKKLMK